MYGYNRENIKTFGYLLHKILSFDHLQFHNLHSPKDSEDGDNLRLMYNVRLAFLGHHIFAAVMRKYDHAIKYAKLQWLDDNVILQND